jgi:hypothetical protein
MTDSVKATRATVTIGSIIIEGFMLPDGAYRMSQTQAAEIIQLTERNAREFLDSKTFKRLTGEAYTPAIFEIEAGDQQRGQSRFRGLPLAVVVIYWTYQCYRGNQQAWLKTAMQPQGNSSSMGEVSSIFAVFFLDKAVCFRRVFRTDYDNYDRLL